ncbi:hypothetical protein S245_046051 [Arachis hypogaea]
MARKKRVVRKDTHSGAQTFHSALSTTIFINSCSSPSPNNSLSSSPPNNDPKGMACTKTTARHPRVAHRPTSSQPSFSRGKRPISKEEEELPPSPTHPSHGTVNDFQLLPVSEPKFPNLIAYKSFYDDFPKVSYDFRHYNSFINHMFFCKDIIDRFICPPKLVNLDDLRQNGLNFMSIFAFQRWIPILFIRENVYPNLMRWFYSNMSNKEKRIASFTSKS